MKHDVMPSIVRVDPEVLQTLLTEVKETVAHYFEVPAAVKQKVFTDVDMWNIRRGVKTASARVRR